MNPLRLIFSPVHSKGFCAFCKAERRYVVKKHVDLMNVLGTLVFGMVTGAGFWGLGDPRGVVVFAVTLMGAEIFVYLRWRTGVVCKYCGFDPVLYNVKPGEARAKVRLFYEQQVKKPGFMLSKSPLLSIYKEQLEQERLKRKMQYVKERQTGAQSLPPSSL